MAEASLRLIKRGSEYIEKDKLRSIPRDVRGIYTLLNNVDAEQYEILYIGMTDRSIHRRIRKHSRSKSKQQKWTHFSFFEVHDNVRNEEIRELEGILRHIFRKDPNAMRLNMARGYKALKRLCRPIEKL